MSSPQMMKLSAPLSTRVVAIICFAVFVWVIWTAQSLPGAFNAADVGPARVPTIAALLGLACCVLLFFQAARLVEPVEIGRPLAVLAGAVTISAYVLAMPHVGFYPASFVAAALLMLASGERRIWALAGFSAGFCAFIYLGFDLILNVQFP